MPDPQSTQDQIATENTMCAIGEFIIYEAFFKDPSQWIGSETCFMDDEADEASDESDDSDARSESTSISEAIGILARARAMLMLVILSENQSAFRETAVVVSEDIHRAIRLLRPSMEPPGDTETTE